MGNPYIRGCGGRKGVLEDTFPGLFTIRSEPSQAPTPGALNRQKEPDPEKHAFYVLFGHFLNTFCPDPLPLAPLFAKTRKNPCRKRDQLYRLLRLLLETAKTAPRVRFPAGKWPVLWHISVSESMKLLTFWSESTVKTPPF